MSREDKMQRGEAGSGSLAGRIFAFVGVTLAVLILAALAAVFIITKGPSPAARAEFVKRTEDSGLSFVTKLFVPGDEIEAILAGDETDAPEPEESAAPEESEAPAESETPAESEAPAESAEPSDDAGETSGEGE